MSNDNDDNNNNTITEPAVTVANVVPNATLYIKNLDWKIKKNLLRRALYNLFTRHGKVLDIITLRKDGLRGQAFVIMETIQSATTALHAEQGFTFFNKDMIIEYAHTKSDIIAKRDGDYIPKAQRKQVKQQKRSLTMITNDTTEDDNNNNNNNTAAASTTTDPVIHTTDTNTNDDTVVEAVVVSQQQQHEDNNNATITTSVQES